MILNTDLVRYVVETNPDWFDILQLTINVILVTVALYALVQTNRTIKSSEKARKITNMPLISISEFKGNFAFEIDDETVNELFKKSGFLYLKNSGNIPAYNVNILYNFLPVGFVDPNSTRKYIDGKWRSIISPNLEKNGSYTFSNSKAILNPGEKLDIYDTSFETMFSYLLRLGEKEMYGPGYIQKINGDILASWEDYYKGKFIIRANLELEIWTLPFAAKDDDEHNIVIKSALQLKLQNPEVDNPYY